VKSFLEVLKTMYESFSQTNARRLIKILTNYHRVPGSNGIIDAAHELERWLKSYGVAVNVEYFRVDGSIRYFAYTTPIGWEIYDAYIKLIKPKEEILHRFIDSPTMVLTYSPPGKVEGEVVYVGRGVYSEDYKDVDVEGKVVLAWGSPAYAYRQACGRGAVGFIYFSKDRCYDGVPYASVRLRRDEIKEYKIPAIAISRRIADRILRHIEKGEKVVVEIEVKSEIKDENKIPVITSFIEGKSDKEIWLTAHLCHPSPGANDNASGVVGLAEGLRVYNELLNKGVFEKPKHSLRIVWTAEWLGYLAYMSKLRLDYMKDKVLMGINLDMIGGDEVKTDSVLRVKKPPVMLHSILEVFAEEAIKMVTRGEVKPYHRGSIDTYSSGSDHDPLIAIGIPSIMVITWPDKYYHTDLDRVDNINFTNMAKCSSIAYAIPQYLSVADKHLGDLVEAITYYISKTCSEHMFEGFMKGKLNTIEFKLRGMHIRKYMPLILENLKQVMGIDIDISKYTEEIGKFMKVNGVSDEEVLRELKIEKYKDILERRIKLNYNVLLLPREIADKLSWDDKEKFLKIVDELERKILSILVFLTLSNGKTVLEFMKTAISELGELKYDKLVELIMMIEKSGYISLT